VTAKILRILSPRVGQIRLRDAHYTKSENFEAVLWKREDKKNTIQLVTGHLHITTK